MLGSRNRALGSPAPRRELPSRTRNPSNRVIENGMLSTLRNVPLSDVMGVCLLWCSGNREGARKASATR